ncbi:unnamed protein product [Rotaria sordida]|uniref:G-protein coupled receptors family 1 profile domain-containing protein n=1 Tax=Rotaria sordida TaxID=392033 RepID=A0A815LAD5_9BILA|nr:unnamed protein product [Rotaria sordida]CAF1624859.1 unnamed protein product [Rotaria sordida]
MSIFQVALQIQFWSPIIFFSIGAPAACLNAILFIGVKTFRRSPSAYYVVGQSLADVSALLIVLFQIVPSISISASSIACKLMVFFVQMTVSVAMSFLCLSAFDRWACTSQSAQIRQLSSIRVARRLFIIPFILWSLVNIPFLIYCDLVPPIFMCWFTNDLFMKIGVLVLSPILTVLLPLIVLILFELLTYCNIRLVTRIRQQPNQTRLSTWEQQMTRMMLTQTLLSIFCTLPRAIFTIYTIATIDESATRSFDQQSIILLVDQLTVSIASMNFVSSFYIFLLASPRFRQTIRMCLKRRLNLGPNQIAPTNILLTAPTLTGRQIIRGTAYPMVQIESFRRSSIKMTID